MRGGFWNFPDLLLEGPQLFKVQGRQSPQDGAAARRQVDHYEAPIAGPGLLAYQAAVSRPLDQAHHRIVPLLEEFGQFGNSGPPPAGESGYAQQQLMLLGRDATGVRGALAEPQKPPQPVTETGQAMQRRSADLSVGSRGQTGPSHIA